MGRAREPGHVFVGWSVGVSVEVCRGLGRRHAAIPPAMEFAELLAAVWSDYRTALAEPRRPPVRGHDDVCGAAFYLAGAGHDGETVARCGRTDMAGRAVFCANRESSLLSGVEREAVRRCYRFGRRGSVACSQCYRTMDTAHACGQRAGQHRAHCCDRLGIYVFGYAGHRALWLG